MNGYDVDRAMALRERALQTLRALPGVTAVSTASRLPLAPDINMDGILVPGHHAAGRRRDAHRHGRRSAPTTSPPSASRSSPGAPSARTTSREERRVAIVNETIARQYWPDGSAVGRLLYTGTFASEPFEIVGVARDHKVRSVGEESAALPASAARRRRGAMRLVVRTATPAAAALPMLRQALWTLEPDILFTEDAPAEQVAATTRGADADRRDGARRVRRAGAAAGRGRPLRRHRLLGQPADARSRDPHGARRRTRRRCMRMILGQGGRLALAGVALGALAAAGVAQVLESLLYGVSGFDPLAYAAAAGLLLLVALAANLVPALTAARVDPVRALRNE